MKSERVKRIAVLMAAVCVLGLLWPTVAAAFQNGHQFNQSWLILGPYYRKNTGANPGNGALRLDYLTDGVVTERTILPTTGAVVNTNYSLPQCGSYSFVWRTNANGKDAPTIFRYDSFSDLVDYRGGVFNQPGDDRLENTMVYAFAFANNLTGANITNARVGVDSDDSIMVLVNGVERYINNVARGVSGNANNVANASGSFTLYPGNNLVAVKTYNGGGGFAMRCKMQRVTNTGVDPNPADPALMRAFPPTMVIWQTGGAFTYPPYTPPADQATANRWIRQPLNYTPGQPVSVDVEVTTSSGRPSPVVREYPPSGWTISITTTTLGTASVLTTTTAYGTPPWTGQYIRWDVGPMTYPTNLARMTYTATPPPTATGNANATGTVTTDASRMIGGSPWGGRQGREVMFYGPTATQGVFTWAGDIGLPPIGGWWTARMNVPPITSGTAQQGDPWFTGRTSYAAGTYTISGSGHDIWDNSDACQLVAQRLNLDSFILQADIMWTSCPGLPGQPAYRGDGTNWAKAFVMVRNSLHSGTEHVDAGIRNYYYAGTGNDTGDFIFQWRDGAWGGSGSSGYRDDTDLDPNPPAAIAPIRVRLVRRGSLFEPYQFRAGAWVRHRETSHVTGNLAAPAVDVGLAVTSHHLGTTVTAQFSNVSITGVPVASATRSLWDVRGNPATLYSTEPITVKIFLRYGGGGPAAITVRDFAPTSWTITGSNPVGAVDESSTITYTLGSFNADTTLSYTIQPPLVAGYILPAFWGNGIVNDQTNALFGTAIGGAGALQRYLVTTFQQGRFPTSAYAGTVDSSIIMWYSGTRNQGWTDDMEEGENNRGTNDNKMMLVKFDVGAISPAATVYQAKLMLYHRRNRTVIGGASGASGTLHRIYAARINRPWIEGCATNGTDGRLANLDEVTWWWARNRTSPWASGGLRGAAFDNEPPESFADATTFTRQRWLAWDVTRMVDKWVHEPSSNYGIKLSQDDQNTTHYPMQWRGWPANYPPSNPYPGYYAGGILGFRSRNYGTASLRPILAVMAFVPAQLSASHWELYR